MPDKSPTNLGVRGRSRMRRLFAFSLDKSLGRDSPDFMQPKLCFVLVAERAVGLNLAVQRLLKPVVFTATGSSLPSNRPQGEPPGLIPGVRWLSRPPLVLRQAVAPCPHVRQPTLSAFGQSAINLLDRHSGASPAPRWDSSPTQSRASPTNSCLIHLRRNRTKGLEHANG